ncbi:MAG: hypothetical protein JWM91_409 [Rhodospirillales bacterium]|nr:hypothetical protein [Rhodospirillales bacterium]
MATPSSITTWPGIDRPELLKQRRVLLGFTFALTAIHLLDVTLKDEVTVQGIVFSFKNPEVVVAGLWIAWFWAVWRYWQYERTYANGPLQSDRLAEYDRAAAAAVTAAIQGAVDRGDYEKRGVSAGQSIRVTISAGDQFYTPGDDREWAYPNLEIVVVGEDQSARSLKRVQGGVNCTLDRKDVAEIKRSVERRLFLRYPHFADWKAPYFLMWLAPLAGLIALGRHFRFWLH